MKRLIAAMCLSILVVCSLTFSALADGDTRNYGFGFTTQCVSENGGLSHAPESQLHKKEGNCEIIEVRHQVVGLGSDKGFTNYIAAWAPYDGMYLGHKWQLPDMIYHSCTSNQLKEDKPYVAPGGRGNTKYHDNGGLTSVRIEGQFRPH